MHKPSKRTGTPYTPNTPSSVAIELVVNGQKVMTRRFSSSTVARMCAQDGDNRSWGPYQAAKRMLEQVSRDVVRPSLARTLEMKMSNHERRKPRTKNT